VPSASSLGAASRVNIKAHRKLTYTARELRRLNLRGLELVVEWNTIMARAQAEGRTEATAEEEKRAAEISAELERMHEQTQRVKQILEGLENDNGDGCEP